MFKKVDEKMMLRRLEEERGAKEMSKTIERIIDTTSLTELLSEIEVFCEKSYMRDDDTECMKLKETVANKTDSDIHRILASYLSVCDDGDEVIESLYEFVSNCKGFAETDEDTTQQVTKDEFETILNECEEKCEVASYIQKNYTLIVAEVPMEQKYREVAIQFKEKEISLFLPRIDKNISTTQYIAEELGGLLYEIAKRKLPREVIVRELHRYIPETRKSEKSIKQHFRKYFYSVVLYKERKPGIYTKFDEYMKKVLDMEFFKRLISEFLKE